MNVTQINEAIENGAQIQIQREQRNCTVLAVESGRKVEYLLDYSRNGNYRAECTVSKAVWADIVAQVEKGQ